MRILFSTLVVLVIVGLDGCFTAPSYPVSPRIQFLDDPKLFYFSKGTGLNGTDELVISLKFQDGDGDLGLDTDEPNPIYALQYFFIRRSDGVIERVTDKDIPNANYINFKFKKANPNFNLPDYNCTSWEFKINKTTGVRIDTVYTELNSENHYNIFIDYFIKNNSSPTDTSYTKFDAYKYFAPNCPDGTFLGARFSVLSSDLGKKSALDGILTYSIRTLGIDLIFGVQILKLRIRIQDRAFNKSNVIETRAFTLPSIRR